MESLLFINNFIKTINIWFDTLFLWGGLYLILQYPFRFFARGMDKYDKEKLKNPGEARGWELLSQTFILFLAAVIAGFFWVIPELAGHFYPANALVKILTDWGSGYRWIGIFVVTTFFMYVFGHEFGEKRWLSSSLGHGVLIFLGLALDGWMGIFFISLPVLAAYYFVLYRLAMVAMPTSNPEDPKEQRERFKVFLAYTWGIQFPIIVVDGHAWKKPEARIKGDFTWDYPLPGLIWTQSHQVVGITSGTTFKRVEGPGLVFTGKLERAEQIFDLRRQLRTNEINVVTRDGISLIVVVLSVFRIDNEAWSDELYKQLRTTNPLLRGAQTPSRKAGIFAYSPQRVQAALSITSSKAGEPDSTIYWDQWAVDVIEDHARKVIAQKNLDELWRLPKDKDAKFSNALQAIAKEIKAQAEPILRASGILLYASSIVNFRFPTDKDQAEITKQQIHTWGSEWEGKRSNIMAEAEARSKRSQQEARAYAASLMLQAIEEGLHTTQELSPDLPPHITAMLFSALQEYIDKAPDEITSKDEQHYVKETQEYFIPHADKKP